MTTYDVFICHASEDKEDLVRPLAKGLLGMGLRVWYDEFTLSPGDSLTRRIDRGLADSAFAVVVLSPAFFAKEWPRKELDALVSLETTAERRIVPVWHRISRDEVAHHSPLLADRLAVNSEVGLKGVIWTIYSKVTASQVAQMADILAGLSSKVTDVLLEAEAAPAAASPMQMIQKQSIRDGPSFVKEVLRLLTDAKEVSVRCMDGVIPYVFYGGTQEGFQELRGLECTKRPTMLRLAPEAYAYWDGFWRAYRRGVSFRYAVSRASLMMLENILANDLPPTRSLEILHRIKDDLNHYRVDVRIVKGDSPYCMFISQTAILFTMISPRVSGVVANDADLVEVYRQMYDLYYTAGQSIFEWIDSMQLRLTGSEQPSKS